MSDPRDPTDAEIWWRDKAQKGGSLVEEIKSLAERAGAAGFQTTEYILNLAVTELWKDVKKENESKNKQPK